MPERKANLKKLRQIEKNLKVRIAELSALYQVSQSITSSTDLDKLLNIISKKVALTMKTDVCMIHLLRGTMAEIKASYGRSNKMALLQRPLSLKHSVLSRVVRTKRPLKVDACAYHENDTLCAACRKADLCSILIAPVIEKTVIVGFITVCKNRYDYTKDEEEELVLFASQVSLAIENAWLIEEEKKNYLNTVQLLVSVIDAKDRGTENHSKSVMRLTMAIGRALGLSERQEAILKYASLLHDIGKVGIDINILKKSGPLTAKEWVQMRTHPRVGADIIKKAGFLDELIPAILYHHVRYNGGGYPPTKKKHEKIPIEARILSVADAYESMTSDRPYRKHLSKEEAIAELKRYSGTQFDPKVVGALLKYLNM